MGRGRRGGRGGGDGEAREDQYGACMPARDLSALAQLSLRPSRAS